MTCFVTIRRFDSTHLQEETGTLTYCDSEYKIGATILKNNEVYIQIWLNDSTVKNFAFRYTNIYLILGYNIVWNTKNWNKQDVH